MTNREQLAILKQSVKFWNQWRNDNPDEEIDLSGSDLYGADLRKANLNGANLERAFLEKADLVEADLMGANLSQANLVDAHLFAANLTGANLSRANLFGAELVGANLNGADLTYATLANANLANTKVDGARVTGSWVYAVNVWEIEGEFAEQRDLIITHRGQPTITVDNIKVAQFIYLILNNTEIREAINSLTSKTVLILGRFSSPGRKVVLEALKNGLREYNLLTIVFEFDRPADKDFTETIKTLASLSFFVVADITNPRTSPLTLDATIPDYQIPFVPVLQAGEKFFWNVSELQKQYSWVLNTVTYWSAASLIEALGPSIIEPAIKKHNQLKFNEAIEQRIRTTKDFLDKGKRQASE